MFGYNTLALLPSINFGLRTVCRCDGETCEKEKDEKERKEKRTWNM